MTIHRTVPLALAATGAAVVLAACGGGSRAQAPAADPQPAATPSASPSPALSPTATTSVAISNFAFSPAVITVKAGATVTWTNQDEDAHTVAISGTQASQPLQNGDTYTHTFTQPGTYSYLCTIHPFMKGMVVVTGGS